MSGTGSGIVLFKYHQSVFMQMEGTLCNSVYKCQLVILKHLTEGKIK